MFLNYSAKHYSTHPVYPIYDETRTLSGMQPECLRSDGFKCQLPSTYPSISTPGIQYLALQYTIMDW